MGGEDGGGDRNWDSHLRKLSNSTRDSNLANDPASDPSLLHSVNPSLSVLTLTCYCDTDDELSFSLYSLMFINQAILQFFLDFGEVVLHDADPSLRTFLRSCLSREFADPVVAEATLDFLNVNKKKILTSFPTLLPQFFPLLLKLIAWNGEKKPTDCYYLFALQIRKIIYEDFSRIDDVTWIVSSSLSIFSGPAKYICLAILLTVKQVVTFSLPSVLVLVVALQKVERSSGSLIGSSIASIQKSTAPEMLLALMDEAYTGSTIADGGADSESEDSSAIDAADPFFLEFLKDENDGLPERHWTSPAMVTTLQAAINTPQSDRLKQMLKMAPRLLDVYFAISLRDVNDSLICALIPLLMLRNDTMFPDKIFSYEVRKRLLEFMLAAFQRSPNFIALLKKPIMDRLGEAYDSPAKTELALQLCWAIGEHGGGGGSHKDAARELFESLELLLYENLSSSRLGLRESALRSGGESSRKSSQSRLLCFVVTAIAKLASYHRELLPRARVSLGKVARSRISDVRVWKRARDYLGLMNEPAICLSVLGPSRPSDGNMQKPGTVNWSEGDTKMIAHIPFYILGEQEGPPFHDFSFSDILPRR
ncbi:hypothetical protein DKX38_017879 [Salix brachista]|uniref:AP-5 complex subunit zeta-1 n=1 Tax=Salix brachista TaxID=2182728 RepID=A0A5N5KWE5_9ROSI|nr:hypothetical protein DKX38_017879 [Salix brachista]